MEHGVAENDSIHMQQAKFKFRKYMGRRNWPIPSAGTEGIVL